MKNDIFEWFPTENSPKQFPTEILSGDFIFDDNSSLYIPDRRIVHNGWGEIGSLHIVGNDKKAIPAKLSLLYLSYLENKCYGSVVTLPKEKIKQLFMAGYLDKRMQKKSPYQYIKVGIAPGGFITIWVAGGVVSKEVAVYRLKEQDIEWKNYFENERVSREKEIRLTLQETLGSDYKTNVPIGLWKSYREKFNSALNITLEGKIKYAWAHYFNGESQYLSDTALSNETQESVIPDMIKITWIDKNKNSHTSRIHFDDNQINKAFRTLEDTKNIESEITMDIDINKIDLSTKVFLRDNKNIIELKQIY